MSMDPLTIDPAPPDDSALARAALENAQELARFLGTGWRTGDDSTAAAWLLALGEGAAVLEAAVREAMAERFPGTTRQLLPSWSSALHVPVAGLDLAGARALLAAHYFARTGNDRRTVLAALRAIDPDAEIEATSIAVTEDHPRDVFVIAVALSVAVWNDDAARARAQTLLNRMLPSWVIARLCTRWEFLADDDDSLTDRDLCGA